jgi:hypothetical protein
MWQPKGMIPKADCNCLRLLGSSTASSSRGEFGGSNSNKRSRRWDSGGVKQTGSVLHQQDFSGDRGEPKFLLVILVQ